MEEEERKVSSAGRGLECGSPRCTVHTPGNAYLANRRPPPFLQTALGRVFLVFSSVLLGFFLGICFSSWGEDGDASVQASVLFFRRFTSCRVPLRRTLRTRVVAGVSVQFARPPSSPGFVQVPGESRRRLSSSDSSWLGLGPAKDRPPAERVAAKRRSKVAGAERLTEEAAEKKVVFDGASAPPSGATESKAAQQNPLPVSAPTSTVAVATGAAAAAPEAEFEEGVALPSQTEGAEAEEDARANASASDGRRHRLRKRKSASMGPFPVCLSFPRRGRVFVSAIRSGKGRSSRGSSGVGMRCVCRGSGSADL